MGFAPRHHFGPSVMTIAPNGQPCRGPVAANTAHKSAQMVADFCARWCFAGPQQHGDGARRGRVVDMDRQKAPLIVVRVEERKLLVAMDDIDRVVDIEGHRQRRPDIACAVEIDHGVGQANHFTQSGCILPARDRGLRA
jgi:hypothetical protein